MSSRLAGRLLTSPAAFLFAGILDFALFASATLGRSVCSLPDRMLKSLSNIARR